MVNLINKFLNLFKKEKQNTEDYILVLFLGGEKIYGFAFNELKPEVRSSYYVEHLDPFLKDIEDKTEKILDNCQRDLGKGVYLQKTLLILNSLYTAESGAIRENFAVIIKRFIKNLDLTNLGFINFSDAIYKFYKDIYDSSVLIEESVYDYVLYFFEHGKVTKTEKIAKTPESHQEIIELEKHIREQKNILGFFYKKEENVVFNKTEILNEDTLKNIFLELYVKNKPNNSGEKLYETGSSQKNKDEILENEINQSDEAQAFSLSNLPLASGFINAEVDMPFQENEKQFKFDFISRFKKVKLPGFIFKMNSKLFLLLIPAVLVIFFYVFLYKVELNIKTNIKDYSTKVNIILDSGDKRIKSYETDYNLKFSEKTTGEKVVGEKASGEITVFNKTNEKKTILENTRLKAANGTLFILIKDVAIVSATTSGTLNSETKTYGEAKVEVEAVQIGAEGNLDNGSKLTFIDYKEDEFSALSNKDFTGGFKKTIAAFSLEDEKNLEATLAKKIKEDIRKQFFLRNETSLIFQESLEIKKRQEKVSAKVNDEAEEVTIISEGKANVNYISHSGILDIIFSSKDKELTQREVVPDTFKIKELKLVKNNIKKLEYQVSINAKTQAKIDINKLKSELRNKTFSQARDIVENLDGVRSLLIKGKPIDFFIFPLSSEKIEINFEK